MGRFEIWPLLVASALTAACKGSSTPPATTTAQPESVSAPISRRPLIDLRPLTITFEGRPIARLFADGRTESVGPNAPGVGPFLPGPTLHADGMIAFTKGGLTGRIDENGDIYVTSAHGQSPRERRFGRVTGTRLNMGSSGQPGGVRVDDATLVFDGPDAYNEIGKIEGRVDTSVRRTALIMTAAFFIDTSIVDQAKSTALDAGLR